MNIEDIKRLPISELNNLAKELDVRSQRHGGRQDLIFAILQTQAEQNGVISGSGVPGNSAGRFRLSARSRLQLPAQPR